MAMIEASALNPGVRRSEVFGWAAYDFANSGYTTVVLTAVFNAYFVGVVAGNAAWATLAWTSALSLSCLLVMIGMPIIGAHADAHGSKKRLLAVSTIGCVLATAALALTGPGSLWLAMAAIVVSNFFYSMGEALVAAFLPELARRESLGKVSGWGWAFGYCGGMLSLGLSLAYVLSAKAAGADATSFVPVAMLITAALFAIASVPTFVLLKERSRPRDATAPAAGDRIHAAHLGALQRLARTWREARRFGDFRRLLVCGVFYQAGIAVVIALAAVYAQQAMGFTQVQTMTLIFAVNIASAVGAFLFGYVEDRVGHRRGLQWTLVGWIVMVVLAAVGQNVETFWVAATLAGLCMGSSQSCGRAMVGVLAPSDRVAEFYGLWALAVRLSAIIGPLTYGLVTWLSDGNHRMAILSTGLFFVAGLIVLARIDLERGQRLRAD